MEPVLGCRRHRHRPPLRLVRRGTPRQLRVTTGHIRPGIQTGYCADTGGGWSTAGLVAHESQLHAVPDELADVDAVLVEPLACGLHAASAPERPAEDTVAVIGAGTVGLTVIAGLDFLARKGFAPKALLVGARYRHQRSLAEAMGTTAALPSDRLGTIRQVGELVVGDPTTGGMRLSGGADIVFDCVGSEDSLSRRSAHGGRSCWWACRPDAPRPFHAPLWHREVRLVGSYAYGSERFGDAPPLPSTSPSNRQMAQRLGHGRGLCGIPSRSVRGGPGDPATRDAGARSRWSSTSAPDHQPGRDRRRHSDSETEGMPDERPRPGFVLEVDGSTHCSCGTARGTSSTACPRGVGCSTHPNRWMPSKIRCRRSAGRCGSRWATADRWESCCGHAAHDLL